MFTKSPLSQLINVNPSILPGLYTSISIPFDPLPSIIVLSAPSTDILNINNLFVLIIIVIHIKGHLRQLN